MIDPELLKVLDSPYVHQSDRIGGGYTVDKDAPQDVLDALAQFEAAQGMIDRQARPWEHDKNVKWRKK